MLFNANGQLAQILLPLALLLLFPNPNMFRARFRNSFCSCGLCLVEQIYLSRQGVELLCEAAEKVCICNGKFLSQRINLLLHL